MAARGRVTVNADLAKERTSATFDVENLTHFIDGGVAATKRKRYLQDLAINDPELKNSKPWAVMTRKEQYETALRKHIYMAKRLEEMGITDERDKLNYKEAGANHESSPIGVHLSMFLPTLRKQGTEDQRKRYLPLAEKLAIIGTYAQTELGHGTFVRGLETTATYDAKTREFVLNSPTLTSMKYWPGHLGKTVNFCIVMAQLYTNGKCYGMHTFLLPLRDLSTHQSLPGIELGDIGPKFGYGSNDNGYLILNNVRIPRENMLMRYAQVLEDGSYVKPANAKISYGTMTLIRVGIVTNVSRCLAQSCVIAVRYSAVRRQTEVSPGGPEAQILDYQTQQHKLFPLISTAFAIYLTGIEVYRIYNGVNNNVEQGNLDQIGELHGLSAGLKAFTSSSCCLGIEVCRLACGGHGYSQASGLPKIYVNAIPNCTYEGENTVLYLQTARYLMKCFTKVQMGEKLPGFVSYLGTDLSIKSTIKSDVSLESLLLAYEHRAARMVKAAAMNIQGLVQEGFTQQEAWNKSTQQLVWATMAHCHTYVVKTFTARITGSNLDDQTKKVMTALCKLYGVHGMVENLGDFIQDGFMNASQVDTVTRKLMYLLAEIRPNAVALVDAFDYPDQVLDSCLGRYDGDVYKALYEYAKASPLNNKDVLDSFNTYLRPLQGNTGTSSLAKL
ncbi:peroxisomal acyl-coenzyme A oxidase 1-like [Mizuhopecten yessoensis]|uniref:Acyl-coenzyme A oxidase n=1 Tax=Mizuhopecten yessoensis TaxID=6573 RepID=A0A210Q7H4_MIZYE|nr:peroxisomal acyl-coenzyme A oxidase 1-like [Mizuhopecten yessoensis]OWF44671.1 Peroxisomal acyl-coenzyme A oxidase 1 [Mizuhopecten yessoensis]